MKKAKPESKKQKVGRHKESDAADDRFDEEPEEGRRNREEEPEEKDY